MCIIDCQLGSGRKRGMVEALQEFAERQNNEMTLEKKSYSPDRRQRQITPRFLLGKVLAHTSDSKSLHLYWHRDCIETTTAFRQSHRRSHGSSSQQRKGYQRFGHPIFAISPHLVQEHPRDRGREHLQACSKRRNAFSDRCRPSRQPWCRPGQGRDW